jgi:hypothetical protein
MTTAKARVSGENTARAVQNLQEHRDGGGEIPRGLVGQVNAIREREPFKDVSVFMKLHGLNWDMIRRIACDPAHQFYNLVKDLLSLTTNFGPHKFSAGHLQFEKDHGRFQSITTVRKQRKRKGKKKKKKTRRPAEGKVCV